MKISIYVASGNDAFCDESGELDMQIVANDLHEIVHRIGNSELSGKMRDVNGNTAFRWNVTD